MADKTKKIDAVDTKIIKLLQINARTTASDICREYRHVCAGGQ